MVRYAMGGDSVILKDKANHREYYRAYDRARKRKSRTVLSPGEGMESC